MAKRPNVRAPRSPFADLVRIDEPAAAPAAGGAAAPPTAHRRRGKSADPDFVKLTSYIRKDTHLQVKRQLLGTGKDISELVEELLESWIAQHA